jgi:hypothetical protein
VLCVMFTTTPIMTDGYVEEGPTAWPPRSPNSNPLDFLPLGTLKALAYAAPLDNEEALHNRTVNACQTIHKYSWNIGRKWQPMMRCIEACAESPRGHFEHLL